MVYILDSDLTALYSCWSYFLEGTNFINIIKEHENYSLKLSPVKPSHKRIGIPIEKITDILQENKKRLELFIKEIFKSKSVSIVQELRSFFVESCIKKGAFTLKDNVVYPISLYLFLLGTKDLTSLTSNSNYRYLSEWEVARIIELFWLKASSLPFYKTIILINILNLFNYNLKLSEFNLLEEKVICHFRRAFVSNILKSYSKERFLLPYVFFFRSNEKLKNAFLSKLKTFALTSPYNSVDKILQKISEVEKFLDYLNSHLDSLLLFNKDNILSLLENYFCESMKNELTPIFALAFKTRRPKRIDNFMDYIKENTYIILQNITPDVYTYFSIEVDKSHIENRILKEINNIARTLAKKDVKTLEVTISTKALDKIVEILNQKIIELKAINGISDSLEKDLKNVVDFNLLFKESKDNILLLKKQLNRHIKKEAEILISNLKEILALYYEKKKIEESYKGLLNFKEAFRIDTESSIIKEIISHFKKGVEEFCKSVILSSTSITKDLGKESFSFFNLNLPEKLIIQQFGDLFDKILDPSSKITGEEIESFIVLNKNRYILIEEKLFLLNQVVKRLKKKIQTSIEEHSSILSQRLQKLKDTAKTHLTPWVYFIVFDVIPENATLCVFSKVKDNKNNISFFKILLDIGFLLQVGSILNSKTGNEYVLDLRFWDKKLFALSSKTLDNYKEKIATLFARHFNTIVSRVVFEHIAVNLIQE